MHHSSCVDLGQFVAIAIVIGIVWMVIDGVTGSARNQREREAARAEAFRKKFLAIPGHEEMNEETWSDRWHQVESARRSIWYAGMETDPEERERRERNAKDRYQDLLEAYRNKYGVDHEG